MAATADNVIDSTLTEPKAPVDAENIADLARRAGDLNETIRDMATHPDHRKTLRKFVGPEVAQLLGLKVETLYRRIERQPKDQQPRLPQGSTANPRCREFSLEEVFT